MAKQKCANCGTKGNLTGRLVKHERLQAKIIMICERCNSKKPKEG